MSAEETSQAETDVLAKGQGATADNLDPSTLGTGPTPPAPPAQGPAAKVETPEEIAEKARLAEAEAVAAADAAKTKTETETVTPDPELEAAKLAEIEANEYMVYDDEAADSATALLKESGVSVKTAYEIFEKACTTGKLEDVNLELLTQSVGASKAKLVMLGVTDYFQRNVVEAQARGDALVAELGGKAAMEKVVAWAAAKAAADPEFAKQRDDYRKMIDASPLQAKLAGEQLLKQYNADPKNSSLKVVRVDGTGAASVVVNEPILSRNDYLAAIKAAEAKGDRNEINRLNAARKLAHTKR